MKNTARGWLFDRDAREEIDRAIAECKRDHGSSPTGKPSVIRRTFVRNDGSEFEATAVFVNDDDGWWDEYARVHGWPEYTLARIQELCGEKEPDPAHSPPRGSTTVLVADNAQWVRDPIAGLLRQAGYETLTAADGRDAVAVFEEHAKEIEAVLLDCHLPGGPGDEIFEELRRIRPNIPVIMMSGFAEEDSIGRFLGMGVVGFLKKPFGPLTLFQAVKNALDQPAA
jgi:CheY-like chemotaxis protein